MPDRAIGLQYKRQPIRATLEQDGVWLCAEDVGLALGLKDPKGPVTRLPEHEKSLRQIGGAGVRMRVLSPDGVLRIAGSTRSPGASGFLKWFQEQAMPALGETAREQQGQAGTELVVAEPTATPVAEAIRTLMFESTPVRSQMDGKGEILFRAEDVCAALELSNPHKAVADHVAPDDLTKREVIDSMGRPQQANYVYLPGLYSLVFGSKKDAARRFKRWVRHDVLPSIQKTGSYSLHSQPHSADETTSLDDASERVMLQRAANLGSLMLSLPGADDAHQRQREDLQIKARQALVLIQEAAEGLKGLRLHVTFEGGLDRPQAQAMPGNAGDAPFQGAATDKAMAGRTYVLDFNRGVGRPNIRVLRHDERIVKADREGVKFLGNQARLGLEDWRDLEQWAQRKVRAEENRRD